MIQSVDPEYSHISNAQHTTQLYSMPLLQDFNEPLPVSMVTCQYGNRNELDETLFSRSLDFIIKIALRNDASLILSPVILIL